MPRTVWTAALLGALLVSPAAPALDIDNPPQGVFVDEWYALLIKGRKSGHMHTSFERRKGDVRDTIRSHTDMVLTAGRGDAISITVSVTQQDEETLDGRPISFSNTQKIGMVPKSVRGTFKDGKVTITSQQFGKDGDSHTYDVPPEAMMGWALYRQQIAKGLKPGTKYSQLMYDPTTAEDRAISAKVEIFDMEKVDLFGRSVSAIRTKQTVSLKTLLGEVPVETTTWVKEDGTTVKMEMSMMGIPFEMLACSKPVALAKDDPSDLMDHTLVEARGVIDPRARTIRYRITGTSKEGPTADMPETTMQRVEDRANKSFVLRVSRSSVGVPQAPRTQLSASDRSLYLEATPILNFKDPEVARLVKQAAGDVKDPHQLADRLREFVSDYIENKNLSVGFATASEVARSKEGDCTEHGVLLAALGRGVGIPTRLATGLVHTDEFNGRRNVFVGHLWTQFFIDGRWVDQDAALHQDDVDATHIALSVNAASDNGIADLVGSLWLTMGQLQIEALSDSAASQPAKNK